MPLVLHCTLGTHEKEQLTQIKFQKLKLILYDDEKILIPTLELLNPSKILECIDTIISSGKINFNYVMFLLNYLVERTSNHRGYKNNLVQPG